MSKADKLFDGITNVREDLLEQAETHVFKTGRRRYRFTVVAVAGLLIAAILAGTVPGQQVSFFDTPVHAATRAEYPEMTPYPGENADWKDIEKWMDGLNAQYRDVDAAALQPYLQASIPQFLQDNGTDNALYSPLNVYMALAMLAEVTDGDSRQQILHLLGAADIDALRQQANDLWNANYRDDGIMQRVLANSLWLSESYTFRQETLDRLAEQYFASSFCGQMGAEEFNTALRDWLNEQTGGLLGDQIDNLELTPDTVLALASTVYFKAKWNGGFNEANTADGLFHSTNGDVTCRMMKRSDITSYYWADNFTAVRMDFEDGGMWFILPDEGYTSGDLLEDCAFLELIQTANNGWENQTRLRVNMTVPKFDVSSQIKLRDGLQALGVTDVFDAGKADFSPVTDGEGLFVSEATHGVRVKIDEEGCEAAAYTMLALAGAAPPPDEEVDFTADRPFLFCVTGANNLPLFVGVVNQP
ncbi:MAG: serpin family protein [Clostridia bacterium]|nr:serpin family protein [Clostridia bacterium]